MCATRRSRVMSSRFWRARRCRALRLTRILREASAVHVYLTAIPAAFAAHSNCRVAVLYSGHVRSFAHPRVHESHRRLLIEPLEAECKVDVFMHVSVEDEVQERRGLGSFADGLAFAAYTPQNESAVEVLASFSPVSLVFHQEQAGQVPNRCRIGCRVNAYWQLYKMAAVYRLMEHHEIATQLRYDWAIRARLDIGWMQPMLPLSRFPQTRVYANHNFFPLADQFLLVPRQFAGTVFGTVQLCYSCKVLEAEHVHVRAQTESLLAAAMRRSEVPFGYYEFPIVIVRYHEGGVCDVLRPHKLACQLLSGRGMLVGDWTQSRCADVVNEWYERACAEMFPPLDQCLKGTPNMPHVLADTRTTRAGRNTRHSEDNLSTHVLKGGNISTNIAARPEHGDVEADFDAVSLSDNAAATDSACATTFNEATSRLTDLHPVLHDLAGSIKVPADAQDEHVPYVLAFHYPFHLPDGKSINNINVMTGFLVSDVEFTRLALAFACLLADALHPAAEHDKSGRTLAETPALSNRTQRLGGENESLSHCNCTQEYAWMTRRCRACRRAPTIYLDFGATTSDDVPAEGADAGHEHRANIDCAAVQPMHDVWMALLASDFRPSESACVGSTSVCVDRIANETFSAWRREDLPGVRGRWMRYNGNTKN